jgi:polyisoprenoid-binding protein YceI
MKTSLLACISLAVAATTVPALADPVIASQSSITATFKQMGVSVDAPFKKFSANIDFDPAKPASAQAQFTIEIASFDLGGPDYNKEILKPEWFDAAKFPEATFVSTSLKPISPTQLQAQGKLTIKGHTQDVSFNVDVKGAPNQRTYDAILHINRTAFNVGEGEWKATDTLADDIAIKVHAVTSVKS